jgi:hypothetical protein
LQLLKWSDAVIVPAQIAAPNDQNQRARNRNIDPRRTQLRNDVPPGELAADQVEK